MIISHRYKFLFIGLPFSASSTITKDLHEEHDGKPYLRKHSNRKSIKGSIYGDMQRKKN